MEIKSHNWYCSINAIYELKKINVCMEPGLEEQLVIGELYVNLEQKNV